MRIYSSLIIFIIFSSCGFVHKTSHHGILVRITNVDTISTTGYQVNETSFPGLKPGDTTDYKLIEKLGLGDLFTIIIKSSEFSRAHISDCNNCEIVGVKKVTISMKLLPQGQTKSKFPLVGVDFHYDDK